MTESSIDIGKQQVASVYAKALLGAAENSQATDSVREELDSLVEDVLDKFPDFEVALSSRRLLPEEKLQLLERVLGGRASDVLLRFLKVLARHERLDCLRQVRRRFRHHYNELRQRVEVRVATARELAEPLREQIVAKLREQLGCEVDLICEVEPALIGGLVVRVGDTVIDGSVRNRLVRMRGRAVQRVVEQIHGDSARFAELSTSS